MHIQNSTVIQMADIPGNTDCIYFIIIQEMIDYVYSSGHHSLPLSEGQFSAHAQHMHSTPPHVYLPRMVP